MTEDTTRRATPLVVFSALAMAAAFVLAVLPLGGDIAAYEFERGAAPSDSDVLLARIAVVASIVAAVLAAVLLGWAATVRTTRWLTVIAVLFVIAGLGYLLLILVSFELAF